MVYVIKIIYGFLLPPGTFILFLLGLAIYLYVKKTRGLAFVSFAAAAVFYIVSCNAFAQLIEKRNDNVYPLPENLSGDCIVMLGEGATGDNITIDGRGELSGNTALNVITVLKIYNKTKLPIILSGGTSVLQSGNEALLSRRELLAMHIPDNKIMVESQSRTTQENAKFTAAILARMGWSHPILVTSAGHMARSVELFKKEGIAVTPLPTLYSPNNELSYTLFDFIPSANGLTQVSYRLKELLGRLQ